MSQAALFFKLNIHHNLFTLNDLKRLMQFPASNISIMKKTCLRLQYFLTEHLTYCRSGNFRVFKFSRISDFGTFHED